MSASAIVDSLVTMLSAASAFGSGGASTDYDILETTSGCCCVVSVVGLESTPVVFGDPRDRNREWTFSIEGFSKVTANRKDNLKRIPAMTDVVLAVIEADDTLQGEVDKVNAIRAEREPGAVIEIGTGWLPVQYEIDATEQT